MAKIEELLTPGEKVIKKQGRITVGNMAGMPSGDLYLTNRRILFLHSKGWSLLSPAPGAALMSKNVIIPLQDIKSVKKGFGSLKVQAEKEYEFMVSVWKAGGWVDAVQQAIRTPSSTHQPHTHPRTPKSQPAPIRFCTNCGSPLKPEDKFCGNCGARIQ